MIYIVRFREDYRKRSYAIVVESVDGYSNDRVREISSAVYRNSIVEFLKRFK